MRLFVKRENWTNGAAVPQIRLGAMTEAGVAFNVSLTIEQTQRLTGLLAKACFGPKAGCFGDIWVEDSK